MKRKNWTIEKINANSRNMVKHLGIEFTEMTEKTLSAKMPVDFRTQQPFGVLHGGASVVLAETLGSMAGYLQVEEGKHCVGLEINANHLRSVKTGYVYGRAEAIHLGRKTQVWEIRITDEMDDLVCISRLTTMIIES